MKPTRAFSQVSRRFYRPEVSHCADCQKRLQLATSSASEDEDWLAQVDKNGGIIVSIDGIQPDKGNETIYLVRDALTGRVLVAENVLSSETAMM